MQAAARIREIPAVLKPRAFASPQATAVQLEDVAAYARVSTDSSDQLNSYEAQIKFYTSYIKANPKWRFVKMYSDEGITGTQMRNRKNFLQLIADAKAGKISLIVTKSISRFCRNVVDCVSTVRMLKDEYGVAVYFEKENIMSTDPTAQLTLSILASVAEEESRSISENVKWRIQKEIQNGEVILGNKVYGYDQKDKVYTINPAEALIVRRIFNDFLAGKSVALIANELNAEGIVRTRKNPEKKRVSGKWGHSTILYMLQNEKYMGDARLQKSYKLDVLSKVKKNLNDGTAKMFYVEGSHIGIIDKDTFSATQSEIAKRQAGLRRYASKYPMSQKIVCAECGATYRRTYMLLKSKKAKSRKVVIWICTNRRWGTKKCKSRIYREKDFEDAFVMLLDDVIDNKDILLAEVQASVKEAIEASGDFDSKAITAELVAKQAEMLELTKAGSKDNTVLTRLMDEIDNLNNQLDICRQADTNITAVRLRTREVTELLEKTEALRQYDPDIFRAVVDTVKVDGRQLTFSFKCGITLTYEM